MPNANIYFIYRKSLHSYNHKQYGTYILGNIPKNDRA